MLLSGSSSGCDVLRRGRTGLPSSPTGLISPSFVGSLARCCPSLHAATPPDDELVSNATTERCPFSEE